MDTKRQALLLRIRKDYCDNKTAILAAKIDKDYSYVHRLFYPTTKAGHKGIGLEIMEACNKAFKLPAGFWDGSEDEASNPLPLLETTPNMAPTAFTASPYARLLANTFDALGMDPDTAKQAFVAATQVLIDHANAGNPRASPSPAPVAPAASKSASRPRAKAAQ